MVRGDLRFFATYSYIGLRYSDPGNAQVLPSFGTLDAGIVADIGRHFEIRLQGSGGFALGRPIFGREETIGVKYKV